MGKVSDHMATQPECICASDTLACAARKMKEKNVGVLPVCDAGKNIVGVITDRDLVLRCVAEEKDARTCKVGEVMTKDELETVYADDSLETASEKLKHRKLGRLIVLDCSNGQLVGMLSGSDVARGTSDTNTASVVRTVTARADKELGKA